MIYINFKSLYGFNIVFKGIVFLVLFFEFKGKNVKIGIIFSLYDLGLRSINIYYYLIYFNFFWDIFNLFVFKEIYLIVFM